MLLSRLKRLGYGASNAFLAWHYRRNWGMTIGTGVRISRTAKLDKTYPRGVHIGDYSAIAFDAAIITHDFVNGRHLPVHIGSNCLIGARSVIMPGVKIGDNCIIGIGAVVLSDVPPNTVVSGNPARVVERGITTGKWGIRNPKFLALEGISPVLRQSVPNTRGQIIGDGAQTTLLRELLGHHVAGEIDLNRTFDALGMDSFALVTFRAELEHAHGTEIPDETWFSMETPAQILRLGISLNMQASASDASVGATAHRHLGIDMPQMAMGGLSENWLFKEIGDIHWNILTNSLGVKSRDIADQAGDRLYATFTRIRYRSTVPLSAVQENDEVDISSAMSRFGAGIFFSTSRFKIGSGVIVREAMSSFSKIAESGNNSSLRKGQPVIPPDFNVPELPALPDFGVEYNDVRNAAIGGVLFTTDYEMVPQYDINGVGLLYFAAYPVISEICLSRYLAGEAGRWSPIERDVCYFANCGPRDKIIFQIHQSDRTESELRIVASMTRARDGKRMALVRHVSTAN